LKSGFAQRQCERPADEPDAGNDYRVHERPVLSRAT
jgi:hypothetical protein